MKSAVAVVSSLVFLSIIGIQMAPRAQAQIKPRIVNQASLNQSLHEWHPAKVAGYSVRYDAITGRTEVLTTEGISSGIKFTWVPVTEDKDGMPSGTGFEISEGTKTTGLAIRVQRATGQTWILSSANSSTFRWTSTGTP